MPKRCWMFVSIVCLICLVFVLLSTRQSKAATLELGMMYFPGAPEGDRVPVAAAISQPLTQVKSVKLSADLLFLTNGRTAGAVGARAAVAPAWTAEVGYAPGAYADDFSKEAWKNLCLGALYAPPLTPTALALGALPGDRAVRLGMLPVSQRAYGVTVIRRF